MSDVNQKHRLFLGTATAGLSDAEFALMGAAYAAAKLWKPPARLAPPKQVDAGVLNAGHNFPQASQQAFDDAVLALVTL